MKPIDNKPELVKAGLGMPKWTIVDTPDSKPSLTKELLNPDNKGAEINKFAVASDGITIWAIVRRGDRNGAAQGGAQVMLYRSTDGGLSWSDTQYCKLVAMQSKIENGTFIWDLAIAPDNPDIIAVACADISQSPLTQEVWISTDKGDNWENAEWPPAGITAGVDFISAMDISMDFGGRKILVGTRDGTGLGTNNLQVMEMPNYGHWDAQDTAGTIPSANPFSGDVLAAKFSSTFASDLTIVVVYTDGTPDHAGTWLATGVHNTAKNSTTWQSRKTHVEIRNSDSKEGSSPQIDEIIAAHLDLPSDFHGKTPSRRRFYISTDAVDRIENVSPNRGVYRIDDNTAYTLMDNTATFGLVTANKMTRRAASIAYFGTCVSGKLLVGEVLGNGTQASVGTWFTNSPTVAPIPCWFPSLKPTTGAAGQFGDLAEYQPGYGNAQVVWSPDGAVSFIATGAASLGPFAAPEAMDEAVKPRVGWPAGYTNVMPCDESAFGLSRNNGETWNQLSLINTFIAKLTDVAPSADGSTIYLASVNTKAGCAGFDSVWRSTINPAVAAPLPTLPQGGCWERVLCHVTAEDCMQVQSDHAILRLAPDKEDGQIVFWAACETKAIMWTPDYGDYWAAIRSRINVQDMAAGSSTMIYILDPTGMVQKMPYTGTAWSSAGLSVATGITGHMIAVWPERWVLVGASVLSSQSAPVAYSVDDGKSFTPIIKPTADAAGNVHVVFDSRFDENNIIYAAFDDSAGSIYRGVIGTSTKWDNLLSNIPARSRHFGGYFGLVVAYTGSALYGAHGKGTLGHSGIERVLTPTSGLPKRGMSWEHFNRFNAQPKGHPAFTGEPWALKPCGCLTLDTDTVLFAIDNDWYGGNHNMQTGFGGVSAVQERGMLWAYIDCGAKRGVC